MNGVNTTKFPGDRQRIRNSILLVLVLLAGNLLFFLTIWMAS